MPNPLNSLLGNGLLTPLQRMAGRDYASGSGEVLVKTAIMQIMKTNPGDLPWRPSAGGGLGRLRNRNMDELLAHEAEAQAISAITHYEPRARIFSVRVERGDHASSVLTLQLFWGVTAPGSQQTKVFLGPFSTEVTI